MNKEIKEILDIIEIASEIFDCLLKPEECTELLDYITNLQQELEQTKLENKVLKEQMVAMAQPTYTYSISGGSSE